MGVSQCGGAWLWGPLEWGALPAVRQEGRGIAHFVLNGSIPVSAALSGLLQYSDVLGGWREGLERDAAS